MFYLLVIAIIPLLCRGNEINGHENDVDTEARIVGGVDVPYGKYPFVVRLVSNVTSFQYIIPCDRSFCATSPMSIVAAY